jgi:hypothetical protein
MSKNYYIKGILRNYAYQSAEIRQTQNQERQHNSNDQQLHVMQFKKKAALLTGKGFTQTDRQYFQRSQFVKRNISVVLDLSKDSKDKRRDDLANTFIEKEIMQAFASPQEYDLITDITLDSPFLYSENPFTYKLKDDRCDIGEGNQADGFSAETRVLSLCFLARKEDGSSKVSVMH